MMAGEDSLRRSQLIDYESIAGHDGMRSNKSGKVLVKPCKQAEIDFYQSTAEHPDFQYFIPVFVGTLELNQIAEPKASHSRAPSRNLVVPDLESLSSSQTWTPSGGGKIAADHGIALENVAFGFTKPNILDVKLGRRLWADDAPEVKRQKLDRIASETTSLPLGFRIAGMKTFVGYDSPKADNIDGYRKYDKNYGKTFSVDTIKQAFEDYFFIDGAGITKEMSHRVIKRFLGDLRALQEVLESEESRMYSSSLLFVYEGDSTRLQHDLDTPTPDQSQEDSISESSDNFEHIQLTELPIASVAGVPSGLTMVQENLSDLGEIKIPTDAESDDSEESPYKVQAVKIIDFAHATWVPGQGSDENTLFGLRNVIKILEEMVL